jgi:hypothetical protein
VLALAAAGSVFEMDVSVHRFVVLGLIRKCLLLRWVLSGCKLLPGDRLSSGSNGPDKAQQLSGYSCDNLLPAAPSLIYRLCSRCCSFHAISFASSEMLSCRLRSPYQIPGGRR